MEADDEIDQYAMDMYRYLVPRRIGIPEVKLKTGQKELFRIEVGKAILITCYDYQKKLQGKFQRDYPKFTKDLCYFMRYAAEIGFALYDDTQDDVNESILLLTAMILELATFCHVQGHETFKLYLDICWSEIFKNHYKDNFFKKGGWNALNTKSEKKLANFFETTSHNIRISVKELGNHHHWLTRFDKKMNNSNINSADSFSYKSESKKSNRFYSDMPQVGLHDFVKTMGENLAIGESISGFISVNKPNKPKFSSKTGGLTKNLNQEAYKYTPTKELGAIPKRYTKTKERDANMPKTDVTLLEKFKESLFHANDKNANLLRELLCDDKNAKLLLNDRHFLRQIGACVENADDKESYQKILEDSLKTIGFSLDKRDYCDDIIGNKDSALANSNMTQGHRDVIISEESLYENKPNQSLNENVVINSTSLNLEKSRQKKLFVYSKEDICLLKNIVEHSEQSIEEQFGEDRGKLPKVIDMFENLNIKCDFNVQNKISPINVSQQGLSLDEQIRQITDAFKPINFVIKGKDAKRFPEDYLEVQKLMEAEQMKLAEQTIRQSMRININDTYNLLRLSKLFTVEKNAAVHKGITFCLMENAEANRIGRLVLKLSTPDIVPPLNPTGSHLSDVSDGAAVEDKNQSISSLKSKRCNANNDEVDGKLDITGAKDAIIKLVIAHGKYRSLMDCLTTKVRQLKPYRDLENEAEKSNTSLNSIPNMSIATENCTKDAVLMDSPNQNSELKTSTCHTNQNSERSPKELTRIYTDSSDSPTSVDSLHSPIPRTVSSDTDFSSQYFDTLSDTPSTSVECVKSNPVYKEEKQEICSSSSEELFHDARAGWSSDKDEKKTQCLPTVKSSVKINSSRKKKKNKKWK